MLKLIKWILIVLLVLLILIVGSVTVAIVTINPNEFKPQITQQVKKATGRDLSLAGDISWSFYPWLGINLGETSLSNAVGFGDQPFAEIEEVDIKIKLLPLLKKSLQAHQVIIRGASLNLQKNAKGIDNWSDLSKPGEETASGEKSEPSAPDISIKVNGIKISDAAFHYRDQLSGSDIRIEPLNLTTGSIEIGKPIKLNSNLILHQDAMTVAVDLTAVVTANPDTSSYRVDDLNLTQTIHGEGFAEDGLTINQKLSLAANTETQKLSIKPLTVESSGLSLDGELSLEKFMDNPQYTGHFSSNTFSPKALMAQFGLAVLETSDKNALDKASLQFDLEGDSKSFNLRSLQAMLDDSTLSGEFGLENFTTQAMRFNLTLDQLNVDRYLPPASSGTTETSAESTSATAGSDHLELPLEMLRKLNIDGKAGIEKLIVKKLQFNQSSVVLKANKGKLQIAPLSAQAYQGSANISAVLDVRADSPVYDLDINLSGVRSEEILETLFGERYLSGAAGFKAKIVTSSDSISGLQKNLSGTFSAEFLDGTIKGSKLSKKINEARNFWRELSGKAAVSEEISEDTQFSSLTASGNIANGVIRNQDLKILAPVFQGHGKGKVDLPGQHIDYTLSLADDGKETAERTFIPLQIKGPFDDLSFRLRADSVLKDRAKAELEAKKAELNARLEEEKAALQAKADEKKEALKAKAEEKINEKKQDLQKKLESELKDKLKGLF